MQPHGAIRSGCDVQRLKSELSHGGRVNRTTREPIGGLTENNIRHKHKHKLSTVKNMANKLHTYSYTHTCCFKRPGIAKLKNL